MLQYKWASRRHAHAFRALTKRALIGYMCIRLVYFRRMIDAQLLVVEMSLVFTSSWPGETLSRALQNLASLCAVPPAYRDSWTSSLPNIVLLLLL